MTCDPKIWLIVGAGFISGLLLGFLFRNSDAERTQAARSGFNHWFLRLLYAPIWSLSGFLLLAPTLGLLVLVLWLPGHLFGVLPLCSNDFYFHKVALIVGVFIGWFLRYLLWRQYLRWL